MIDLVERLRGLRPVGDLTGNSDYELINPDGPDAADEIERLRKEISRLTGLQRVALIDQDGREVGCSRRTMRDLLREEVFVDDDGTVWTPPTAWAYFAACRALHKARGRPA